jgi:hypothetical protein
MVYTTPSILYSSTAWVGGSPNKKMRNVGGKPARVSSKDGRANSQRRLVPVWPTPQVAAATPLSSCYFPLGCIQYPVPFGYSWLRVRCGLQQRRSLWRRLLLEGLHVYHPKPVPRIPRRFESCHVHQEKSGYCHVRAQILLARPSWVRPRQNLLSRTEVPSHLPLAAPLAVHLPRCSPPTTKTILLSLESLTENDSSDSQQYAFNLLNGLPLPCRRSDEGACKFSTTSRRQHPYTLS